MTVRAAAVAVFFTSAAISACSVSPQQVLELRRWLPSEENRQQEQFLAAAWRLRFAGAEYLLKAEAASDGAIRFSNTAGLVIEFDGAEIVLIEGLPGAFGTFKVIKEGSFRRFQRPGRRTFDATCHQPIEWQLSPDRTGTRVECFGTLNGVPVRTWHSQEKTAEGALRRIVSTVTPGSAPLALEPINPP
jgi:hypothetical protein